MGKSSSFDYSAFPEGYYQSVLETGSPVRRAWHRHKFARVSSSLHDGKGKSLLDIGCFAGSFLAALTEDRFSRQVGIDILPSQIDYANRRFGSTFRRFQYFPSLAAVDLGPETFDCITLIEVIEHLTEGEIRTVMAKVDQLLSPGGQLVITTPNYLSLWPLLEIVINRMSDVNYEEQHITRFHYFNFVRKLTRICPETMAKFSVEWVTTTNSLSPFLAIFGDHVADRMSAAVSHRRWRFPLGNLIMLSLVKN